MVTVVNDKYGTEILGAYYHLKEEGLEKFNKDYLETLEWIKKMPKNLITKLWFSEMLFDLTFIYHEDKGNNVIDKTKFEVFEACSFEGFCIRKKNDKYYLVYLNFKDKNFTTFTEIIKVIAYSCNKQDLIDNCDYIFDNYVVIDTENPDYKNDLILDKVLALLEEKGLKLPINVATEKDNWLLIDKQSSGIYLLYDKDFNLVYLGKAKSLRDRVRSHVKGLTHTKGYYEEFCYIAAMFIPVDRYEIEVDLIEKDFVRNYEPVRNIQYKLR